MTRIQLEITLGLILVLFTGGLLVVYGINEPVRMEEFAVAQGAHAIEVGAELFDSNCSTCHGKQGEGILGLCPPLNDKYFFTERLKDVGWGGALEDYIVATVSSGRMASTRPDLYAGNGQPAMPAWSEHYGGPLRDDQIRYIAAYVMNWEEGAPDRQAELQPAGPPVGTDITVELPEGNAAQGEALATSKGCVGCHVTTTTGPAWMPTADQPGIGARAETRIEEPDYTGAAESPEQYLFESIVNPSVHLVDPYQDLMPKNYGQILTAEDLSNLVAYLLTLR
jgi:mono/diheme cytochrome c family protein